MSGIVKCLAKKRGHHKTTELKGIENFKEITKASCISRQPSITTLVVRLRVIHGKIIQKEKQKLLVKVSPLTFSRTLTCLSRKEDSCSCGDQFTMIFSS